MATATTIGTFTVNGKTYKLSVVQNPNGTWTAGGPHEMRDYASRGCAVRWLKRIYAHKSCNVTWNE